MALLCLDTGTDFVRYLGAYIAKVTHVLKKRVIRVYRIVGTVELTEN